MFPTKPFLKKLSLTAAAPIAACLMLAFAASAQTTGSRMVPLRPPATPLIVRSPYVSTWSGADALNGRAPIFWAGRPKSITGIARVDGHAFVFLGDPRFGGGPAAPPMTQTSLYVTPTQSVYRLTGGGVTVTVDFLSPVEPSDLRRLSVPFGYVFATARSADGRPHAVSLYFDMSGEWAHGDENAPITWERRPIPSAVQAVTAFAVTPAAPKVLGETNEYPMWGTAVFATADRPGLTTQAGQDTVVRAAAIGSGVLDNSVDQDQPRAINSRPPVFAFNFDLGQVGKADVRPVVLALGDSRDPAVSYQRKPILPLWRSYWPAWPQMMAAFYDDAAVVVAIRVRIRSPDVVRGEGLRPVARLDVVEEWGELHPYQARVGVEEGGEGGIHDIHGGNVAVGADLLHEHPGVVRRTDHLGRAERLAQGEGAKGGIFCAPGPGRVVIDALVQGVGAGAGDGGVVVEGGHHLRPGRPVGAPERRDGPFLVGDGRVARVAQGHDDGPDVGIADLPQVEVEGKHRVTAVDGARLVLVHGVVQNAVADGSGADDRVLPGLRRQARPVSGGKDRRPPHGVLVGFA